MRCYLFSADITILQWRAAVLGSLLGGLIVAVSIVMLKEKELDTRMEKACPFPRVEGEVTFAIIREGKLECWNYR